MSIKIAVPPSEAWQSRVPPFIVISCAKTHTFASVILTVPSSFIVSVPKAEPSRESAIFSGFPFISRTPFPETITFARLG